MTNVDVMNRMEKDREIKYRIKVRKLYNLDHLIQKKQRSYETLTSKEKKRTGEVLDKERSHD